MPELPQRLPTQQRGTRGIRHVAEVFESFGWVFTSIPQESDYGWDGFVQVFEERNHTGQVFFVQVKTGTSYARALKREPHRVTISGISKRTINLWKQANEAGTKTMLVWVDDSSTSPTAYWGAIPQCLREDRVRLDVRRRLEERQVNAIKLALRSRLEKRQVNAIKLALTSRVEAREKPRGSSLPIQLADSLSSLEARLQYYLDQVLVSVGSRAISPQALEIRSIYYYGCALVDRCLALHQVRVLSDAHRLEVL